jgi:predicted NBD/HSP70 family sugar kinase
MKKTSTVRVNGNMIFKGHKLTLGLDLGDQWSCYCVLDEAGEILLEQKVATTPEAMKQTFERNTAKSHRPGDRNTFPLGKSAVKGAGTRGAGGARAKGAIDHQEQSKR